MQTYSMPIFERNSITYLVIIALSITLAVMYHPLYILLWPGILLIDDILYFGFAWSIFDSEIAIQRGYQFGDVMLDDQTGAGIDLGFNLYDGDLTKSLDQAQTDKWNFMFEKLQLKPGDRLIDVGCGYGDWMNYARSRGVEVIGVNISPGQAQVVKDKHGIEVIVRNWKDIPATPELREKLYGQFDAVTFMDTVEHYVPSKYRKSDKIQGQVYGSMFEMAWNLLKEDAPANRVFISCLHMTNGPKTIQDNFACYLQTRFHSGYYPDGDMGLIRWGEHAFTELERFDKTEDYRITSVLEDRHFGSPKFRWSIKRFLNVLLLFFIDPHHLHKHMEFATEAWMWHFGPDAFNPEYNNDYQKKIRHVTLYWLVLQKKNGASVKPVPAVLPIPG